MEHAKRMVLVDEKMLEHQPMLQHFQTKQDLSWERPTEQSVKSSLRSDDPTEPEDVKAKRHRQHLTRFLQTKRKLAEEPPAGDIKADDLIDFGPTVDELLDIKTDTKKKSRKSKRAKKKPECYADIEWDRW
jgi:hypothetical protein